MGVGPGQVGRGYWAFSKPGGGGGRMNVGQVDYGLGGAMAGVRLVLRLRNLTRRLLGCREKCCRIRRD